MADLLDTHLGNYRLVRLLGKGGFASVYLGEHRYLNTLAAIKVMETVLADEQVAQFQQEARTIAHLVHPHIVRVLEFGVEEGLPFLVMDYAPSGTLRTRHPRGSRLALAQMLPYVQQIAAALDYAHQHRLIHRDIKPENVLLGQADHLWLSDFGLAVVAHSNASLRMAEVAGTIIYMAPEQFEGKPHPASDQYALAVMVYEWLNGAPPFAGTAMEVAMQHMTSAPPPLAGMPPGVQEALLTALAKAPGQRFPTAQAFAAALQQASTPAIAMTAPSASPAALALDDPQPEPAAALALDDPQPGTGSPCPARACSALSVLNQASQASRLHAARQPISANRSRAAPQAAPDTPLAAARSAPGDTAGQRHRVAAPRGVPGNKRQFRWRSHTAHHCWQHVSRVHRPARADQHPWHHQHRWHTWHACFNSGDTRECLAHSRDIREPLAHPSREPLAHPNQRPAHRNLHAAPSRTGRLTDLALVLLNAYRLSGKSALQKRHAHQSGRRSRKLAGDYRESSLSIGGARQRQPGRRTKQPDHHYRHLPQRQPEHC